MLPKDSVDQLRSERRDEEISKRPKSSMGITISNDKNNERNFASKTLRASPAQLEIQKKSQKCFRQFD